MSNEGESDATEEPTDDAQALPKIDFPTFVMSLAHTALVHLGDAPDPGGAARNVNLVLARQNIDLLVMLQEKTTGNLSGAEEHILGQALLDLQLRYVEIAKSHG